jgi:DNA polymerase I-like protein with 3'-5' exonuclease and polymerase domains
MFIKNPKLDDILLTDLMGIDTEFNSLDTLTANCLVISLINENNDIYVLDVSYYPKSSFKIFIETLSNIKTIIAHNSKAEIGILYSNFGILFRNFYCTMLASQIIDAGFKNTKNMVGNKSILKPHSLVGVIDRYLNIKYSIENKEHLQKSFIGLKFGIKITNEQLEYAAEDVKYLIDLYYVQQSYIIERSLNYIINLENNLTPVLIKMEFKGCLVDVNLHKKNIIKWENELKDVVNLLDNEIYNLTKLYPNLQQSKYLNKRTKNIYTQLGLFDIDTIIEVESNNINYGSTKQLKELFDAINEKLPTDDNGKVSFKEDFLNVYLTNYPNSKFYNFIKYLLKHRELNKLLQTYGESLLNLLDSNNRIRTNYGQVFTSTGRLNSSQIIKNVLGTNLSNIPKNEDIRKIFVPDKGYSFIDSDMVGQELLIAGDFSKDPVLLKSFLEGFDHHSFLASISYSIIFRQKIEIKNEPIEITIDGYTYNLKKLRDVHKSCLFSKIYLGGPKRIQNILNEYLVNHWEPADRLEICKIISNSLDKALPKLLNFLKSKVKEVNKIGYSIANKLGRRRYFDDKESAYGEAANATIQSTGADSIKMALISIDKWIMDTAKNLNINEDELGWIALSVYDQNLVCLNNKYIHYAEKIPELMAEAISYFLTTLKGKSDLNIRTYWGKN